MVSNSIGKTTSLGPRSKKIMPSSLAPVRNRRLNYYGGSRRTARATYGCASGRDNDYLVITNSSNHRPKPFFQCKKTIVAKTETLRRRLKKGRKEFTPLCEDDCDDACQLSYCSTTSSTNADDEQSEGQSPFLTQRLSRSGSTSRTTTSKTSSSNSESLAMRSPFAFNEFRFDIDNWESDSSIAISRRDYDRIYTQRCQYYDGSPRENLSTTTSTISSTRTPMIQESSDYSFDLYNNRHIPDQIVVTEQSSNGETASKLLMDKNNINNDVKPLSKVPTLHDNYPKTSMSLFDNHKSDSTIAETASETDSVFTMKVPSISMISSDTITDESNYELDDENSLLISPPLPTSMYETIKAPSGIKTQLFRNRKSSMTTESTRSCSSSWVELSIDWLGGSCGGGGDGSENRLRCNEISPTDSSQCRNSNSSLMTRESITNTLSDYYHRITHHLKERYHKNETADKHDDVSRLNKQRLKQQQKQSISSYFPKVEDFWVTTSWNKKST